MMHLAISTKRRLGVALYAALGAAITLAMGIGGEWSGALVIGAFYAVSSVAIYLWSGGKGDVAAIMRLSGDERQRSIDVSANAFSALAMGGFAITAMVVQLARGADAMPYAWVCTVGGGSYALAVVVLRRRR